MMLSHHFSLAEMTSTSTGLPNKPSDCDIERLKRLANKLEEVRYALGNRPIRITSGYRGELVNRAVGGAKTSAHMRGDAADFTCYEYGSVKQICLAIIDAEIEFDQLLAEPGWVHFGLSDTPRGQVMTMKDGKYTPWISL